MSRPHAPLWVLTIACLTALAMISCSPKSVSDSDIVATWGDTTVTVADFKDRMFIRHRNEATCEKQTLEERLNILLEYTERDLKLADARRLGFAEREDVQKEYRDAIERFATDLLYKDKVRSKFISEDMLKDFYEKDEWEVRARHILIAVPDTLKAKDTMQFYDKIQEIYQKTKSGENFISLVDRYNEDETMDKSLHGDLGFFNWGKMVDEFQEAAWSLKPGEISRPVRTRYGWHIIQMIEKRPSGLEVRTSQIEVKCNRRCAPAESLASYERAKMILEEAKKPGANFAQLARRYSEDDKTWVNGDVGWLPRGSMPTEYWDLALTMEVGQIAGPVRTYRGYHVIKVTDKRVTWKPLSDEEQRDRIYARLEHIYREELKTVADAFLDSVKASVHMRWNDAAVNKILNTLSDKSAPQNMNLFSNLTMEDRDMLLVFDDLGGLKVDTLVAMFGDHRFPPTFRNELSFIEEMVDPILLPRYLVSVARREGYFERPDVIKEGRRAIDNAMLPLIEREMVYNKATPSEDEVKKYYNGNLDKYKVAATATVYEIMVDDPKFAKDLLERINKGENISTLARRYTLREKSKKSGGKLGPFTQDEYGSISREAFKLQPGKIAGPIQLGNMYSLIQLIEKTPESLKTLEDSRQQIESDLRFQQQKDLKDAWVAELRKFYNLKVDENPIKRVWPLIEPLPEPMVKERDQWKDERKALSEKAKRKAEEDKIKMKLVPGSEQTFRKDGKDIKVKIGEPRYLDKDGKEMDASKSPLKITPEGKMQSSQPAKITKGTPKIQMKPKTEEKKGSK